MVWVPVVDVSDLGALGLEGSCGAGADDEVRAEGLDAEVRREGGGNCPDVVYAVLLADA